MAYSPLSKLTTWLSLGVLLTVWVTVESDCPSGWFRLYSESNKQKPACYNIYPLLQNTFDGAQEYCQKLGGHLPWILTDTIDKALRKRAGDVLQGSKAFWIGLTDGTRRDGTWGWFGGPNLGTFKNILPGVRNTPNQRDCFYSSGQRHSKYWYATNKCSKLKSVICQRSYNYVATGSPTPPVSITCPSNWNTYNDGKTCLFLSTDDKSFPSAREFCQREGGDLVKINDADMYGFINDLINKHRTKYWIGLNDMVTEHKFVWNDEKTKATFTQWNRGEPNDAGHREDCVTVDPRNFKWNDDQCKKGYRYICQRDPLNQRNTPRITTTPKPSVNCGSGWVEDTSSPYCYKFQKERLPYLLARKACQTAEGDLASIHSSHEQSFITTRTASFSGYLWIGASDQFTEGGWHWTDSGPFEFFNFDGAFPKGADSKDCVGIKPDSGKWRVLTCLESYSYVCKKIGRRKPPTIAPKTTPANVPTGKKWGCPPGWIPFRFSCFLVRYFKRGITWNNAKVYCQTQQNADLASISDKTENELVLSSVPREYRSSKNGMWIGFNDKAREYTFSWSDNSPVTYTNWNRFEPNNDGNEDCVDMYSHNGLWNDAECTSKFEKLLACKKSMSFVDAISTTLRDGCPKNYYGYDATCYGFENVPVSFGNAENNCLGKNGHLATVKSIYIQSFLSSLLAQQKAGTAYWIGLWSTTATQNKYVWKSGAELDFTLWARSHTGNERYTCVAMQVATPTGLWLNKNCIDDRLPFICETPRRGYTNPPTFPPTIPNAACPDGWLTKGAMCYKAFGSGQSDLLLPWRQARFQCGTFAQDATLATINNNDVSTLVANNIHSQHLDITNAYWIGLNDLDLEGGYVWDDGSPFSSWNLWKTNEPNDASHSEDCVEWNFPQQKPIGEWNDQSCFMVRNYVCQFPRGSPLFTPRPTVSVGPTGGVCGGSDWTLYKNNCYYLSPEYTDNATVSWFYARELCHYMGSELTSIVTEDENNFLITETSRHKSNHFWIGMNDIDVGQHRWVDKSTRFYWGFGEGEPNDNNGQERCVELRNDGRWNDKNCQDKIGFICKRRPGNYHPIIQPTTIPKGGCPIGYQTHDLASHCYHVYDQNSASFDDASQTCQYSATGGTLVTIRNEFEQNFIMTLLKDLKKPAWIGLTNKRNLRQYQWLDNTVPSYDNWATSAINSNAHYYTGNCMNIQISGKIYGKWATDSCFTPRPYICQSPKSQNLPMQEPDSTGCNVGYVRYGNSCYKYVPTPDIWAQAEQTCIGEQGHLASLTTNYESAFFDVLTASSKTDLWVGLKYDEMSDLYKWTDGWPVIDPQWGVGQPKRLDGGGCVSSNMSTFWEDTSCLRSLPFVCEVNLGPPPTPTGRMFGFCEDGWIPFMNDCYLLGMEKHGRPWSSTYCKQNGAELASILSKEQNVLTQYKEKAGTFLWIGLQVGTTTGYKWDDGSPVDYTHFKDPTSPDNDKGTHEECIVASTSTSYWMKVDCSEKHGLLCKKPQKKYTLTTETSDTTLPGNTSPSISKKPTNTPSSPATIRVTNNGPSPTVSQSSKSPTDSTGRSITNGSGRRITTRSGKTITNGSGRTITSGHQRLQGNSDSNGGMSGGAVVGVVIGVIAVVAIAVLVAIFVRRRYGGNIFRNNASVSRETGIDNALYSPHYDVKSQTLHSDA